jgi:hypothetical protein
MAYGYTRITDDAGRGAVYQAQNPQAVYLPDRGETIIAYRGDDSDPFVTRYDHAIGEFEDPVRVGTNPLVDTDNHGPPSMCADGEGYVYLFYGAHNSPIRVARNVEPGRIDEWEHRSRIDDPDGSYPQPVATDGDLLVFYRAGGGHGPPYEYPQHEYGTVARSGDGGDSWSDLGPVVDATGHPDRAIDAYVMDGDLADGEFRLTWCLAHGEVHDGVRAHAFHAAFDPGAERVSALDGTDFGGTVTWSDMEGSALQAFEGQHATSPKHAFGETTHVTTTYLEPGRDLLERRVATWDDEAGDWHVEAVGDSLTNHMYSGCYPRVNDDGNLEVHAITGEGRTTVLKGSHRGGDFAVFVRGDDGWNRQPVCSADDVDRQLSRISTVRDGSDELASVFVEAENDPEAFDLSLFACGTAFD